MGDLNPKENSTNNPTTLPLDSARWRLAAVWFPVAGMLLLVLIGQSIGGVYGEKLQQVWGWALPNFLPTIALMVSAFAADALKPHAGTYTTTGDITSYCAAMLGQSLDALE